MNNMLTVEEVKNFLEVEQTEVEKYIKIGKLNAYKIGGTYVRFRKEDVLNLRFELHSKKNAPKPQTLFSKASDFWRFNNFYIVSILVVIALAVLATRL
jgi:excisionase family DNA binding protein